MRFYNPEDEGRLNRLVADGAVNREAIEKAVGDRATGLMEALVACSSILPVDPWLAFGIRKGLARVNRTKATAAFVRSLKLAEDAQKSLVAAWVFPFARNAYGQTLVATVPGMPPGPEVRALLGDNPVFCIASLPELGALRAAYALAG